MKLLIGALIGMMLGGPIDVRFPYLTVSQTPSQTIIVHDVNALNVDGLCVVYTSLDERLDDKPYAPRHCVAFDPGQVVSYADDWNFIPSGHAYDVTAELFFADHDGFAKTNAVRVQR